MALGDITATINPDGWSANLSIAGFTTGATYDFGMSGNNVPGANTPYFTVVSLGYDNAGSATTRTRTVYCTKVVRFPYSTVSIAGSYTSGTFVEGETVTQGVSGATAIVVGPNPQSSGAKLYVRTVTGTPDGTAAHTWVGGSSLAIFAPSATPVTLALPTNNEMAGSAAMVVRVSLSDYIFQKDNTGGGNSGTAPTFTASAGFVTNTGGASQPSTASVASSVTQSSTASYPKVVGNWSWPGFQRVTADFTLRAVAFHGVTVFNGATQASPGTHNIACVKFTAADAHSHTATTVTTAPTYDSSISDAAPVVEFLGTMAVSTLTALDVLTCNFIAYPLVGDSGSILDTSSGTVQPTPLYGPITALNDKSNTYGRTFCAISSAGDDTTGAPVNRGSYASDALADAAAQLTPCKTIGGAYAKICAYNNSNYGRNDGGAGEILLLNENYAWVGAGAAFGTKPSCWATIRPATGITTAQAVINSQAGGVDLKDLVKFDSITLGGAPSFYFYGIENLWFDRCVMSSTSADVFDDPINALYVTRSVLAGFTQGLYPYVGSYNMAPALVRGNNLAGFLKSIITYTCIGNAGATDGSPSNTLFNNYRGAGQTIPNAVNCIIAFNKITKFNASASGIAISDAFANTHGFAIVQNLFENVLSDATPMVSVAESSLSTPVNNGIIWNNTFIGSKWNMAYNDSGSTLMVRGYWSVKNNISDDINIKSDTFTAANGARVGNWPDIYGVAGSGNFFPEITGVGAAGSFVFEFPGINSFEPTPISGQPPGDTPSIAGYIAYTDLQGFNGGASPTTGGGTYTLTSSSPAKAVQRDFLLPYDMAGLARSATDAAGAYHYGAGGGGTATWRQGGANVLSGNLIGQAGVFGVLV